MFIFYVMHLRLIYALDDLLTYALTYLIAYDCPAHDSTHDPDDISEEQLSSMHKTRRLWQQAIETSELLHMKTAIRANLRNSPASVS